MQQGRLHCLNITVANAVGLHFPPCDDFQQGAAPSNMHFILYPSPLMLMQDPSIFKFIRTAGIDLAN
jgi:hypothetical protein